MKFQPTRPLRGATSWYYVEAMEEGISTHAPLAGRDRRVSQGLHSKTNFNPRAPCGARPLRIATPYQHV